MKKGTVAEPPVGQPYYATGSIYPLLAFKQARKPQARRRLPAVNSYTFIRTVSCSRVLNSRHVLSWARRRPPTRRTLTAANSHWQAVPQPQPASLWMGLDWAWAALQKARSCKSVLGQSSAVCKKAADQASLGLYCYSCDGAVGDRGRGRVAVVCAQEQLSRDPYQPRRLDGQGQQLGGEQHDCADQLT